MKVGFSYGRCIRDIVKGDVDINDVVVIVSGTMTDRSRLDTLVDEYLYRDDYLYGLDRERCLEVAVQLWESGKIHQPRDFGQYRGKIMEECVWADLFPSGDTEQDPMVKAAWQEYRVMLGLAGKRRDVDKDTAKNNWGSHR